MRNAYGVYAWCSLQQAGSRIFFLPGWNKDIYWNRRSQARARIMNQLRKWSVAPYQWNNAKSVKICQENVLKQQRTSNAMIMRKKYSRVYGKRTAGPSQALAPQPLLHTPRSSQPARRAALAQLFGPHRKQKCDLHAVRLLDGELSRL